MSLPPFSATDLLLPFLRLAPPWLVISALVGLTSAAAFFVVAGPGLRSLLTYLVLGLAIAPVCQFVGSGLPPLVEPFTIGEVDLVLVAAGTWALLSVARLLRL
jgi:hypothetical protein